ncbi:MAG: glycosyltransferase family 2 protein [Deltaproteobacteria bacterium]|nr:glycosyltransferase family 2 protein [Deltaproteobacteria bacterium]TLN02256.1 MAG: glycosyltransferase family 2 protein [bacterium]
MTPRVYIVILNFNNWDDSLECLDSCARLTYDNRRLLLIDNGSREDRSWEVLERYPEVELVMSVANRGFAGGCNLGIELALARGADLVWLLNNDTVVEADSLARLVVDLPDDAGIVSPKIYYYGTREIWSSGGYFNKTAMAVNYTYDREGTDEVGFVTGCAMLIPARIFREYGLLKEEYFLNVEDWEICRRLTRGGKKIYVIGGSVIYHKVSRSKQGVASPLDVYYTVRNRLYFIDEYYSGAQRLCLRTLFTLWWPIWLVKNLIAGQGAIVGPFLHGIHDYLRGRRGGCDRY